MSNVPHLHFQIVQHLQTLKRELDRLSVRQSAIERCRKSVLAQKPNDCTDEDEEAFEEITANLDDTEYDLVTFKDQLRARLDHAEAGFRLVIVNQNEINALAFHQHILDGLKLCVQDATAARDGYDELILNIKELTQLRDQ